MNNRILIIKNPRRIPAAMQSYAALTDIDICYVRGTNQLGSSHVINGIISTLDDDVIVGVISDDTILNDEIVRSVFDFADAYGEIASGWVRIYDGSGDASVSTTPFRTDMSPALSLDEYNFLPYEEMVSQTGVIPVFFSGMALHTMSAELWHRFPAQVHRPDVGGGQSDLHIAQRIHAAGLQINVVASAEIQHLKIRKPLKKHRVQRRKYEEFKHEMFVGPDHEAIMWVRQ